LSEHLSDYSYKVFEFGYDVTLYPVKLFFVKTILEELTNQGEQVSQVAILDEEAKFRRIIELVFNTKTFTETVTGLMKIAKSKNLPY
jgi:hypothetical protein